MKLHSLPTLLLVLLFFYNNSYTQTIPANRVANWSKAGLADTLPDFGNVVNIMSHGAVADGVTPNDTALADALAALNNQPGTIFIPAGNYLFTQPVNLERDSIIIRGEGVSTRLLFNMSWPLNNMFNIRGTIDPNPVIVQQGINKNDSSLVLANTNGLNAGDYLFLYHDDISITTSAWAYQSTGQILKLTKISGDTVFTDNAIRRSYPAGSGIRVRKMNTVNYVGIECLYMERIDSTIAQTNNIDFNAAANCWVSGVESNMTNFSHVAVNYSTHILIRGCYFHHAHSYGEGGEAYGTTLEYTSGDCVIENNIFEHLRHSMLVQAGANGNVFAYNYSTDPFWTQPSLPSNSAGDIVCHGNYPYLNLFEGNIVQNIVVDNSHGINGPFNTFFRNRAETYGIFTVANVSDSMNYAGNEITNALGYYLMNGTGIYEYGNNVKGVITPAGTATLPGASLYLKNPPGYWQGNNPYPNIGTPYAYNQGINTAKQRYSNSQKTDCVRNPKYVSVVELQHIENQITVSPNPFTNQLQILLNEKEPGTEYRLYNISGNKILSGQITGITTDVDATHIPVGMYILEVKNTHGISTREKVVKVE